MIVERHARDPDVSLFSTNLTRIYFVTEAGRKAAANRECSQSIQLDIASLEDSPQTQRPSC